MAGKYKIPTPEEYEAIKKRMKAEKEAQEAAGIEPELKVADELEPEAPVVTRTGGVRFKDCITPLPAAMEEPVKWLKKVEGWDDVSRVTKGILAVALDEEEPILDGFLLMGMQSTLAENYDEADFSGPWKDMVTWLRTGDWMTRTKNALMLYLSAELPDHSYLFRKFLAKNPDIDEERRAWLNAVLNRLKVRRLLRDQREQKQQIDELRAQMNQAQGPAG